MTNARTTEKKKLFRMGLTGLYPVWGVADFR